MQRLSSPQIHVLLKRKLNQAMRIVNLGRLRRTCAALRGWLYSQAMTQRTVTICLLLVLGVGPALGCAPVLGARLAQLVGQASLSDSRHETADDGMICCRIDACPMADEAASGPGEARVCNCGPEQSSTPVGLQSAGTLLIAVSPSDDVAPRGESSFSLRLRAEQPPHHFTSTTLYLSYACLRI